MRSGISFLLLVSVPVFSAQNPQATCAVDQLSGELGSLTAHQAVDSYELKRADTILEKLSPTGAKKGKKLQVFLGAVEVGQIPGLKTLDGKPLNIAAGGISTWWNDMAAYFPKLFRTKAHASVSGVAYLMDNMSTAGMKYLYTVKVPVGDHIWDLGVYRYRSPDGVNYYFLDNPSFKRMTATPEKGKTVYDLRGLEGANQSEHAQNAEHSLEAQRIASAFNQGVAEVFRRENGDIYLPSDYHTAPASYYIRRDWNKKSPPVSTKLLIHNEGYLGQFKANSDNRNTVRDIWNLSESELQHYFMQEDQLLMMAPAVRVAEPSEIFTAFSVSEGSADAINRKASQWPATFGRVLGNTNGFADENRPHLSELLKPATAKQLAESGITDPEVVAHFETQGYRYGFKNQSPQEILAAKALAKKAFQKSVGITVDPNKPLFVAFARMVEQKGMTFVAQNVRHILDSGGQIVVGGPVGDLIGEQEQAMFREIKRQLVAEHNPHAKDFHLIEGPVKGQLKGLMLAGGDFFLIPSRYEPCGLTDCEALFHGTLAIAHNTGGLNKGKNTILYSAMDPNDQGPALGQAINEALGLYRNPRRLQAQQLAAMREKFPIEKNFDKFVQTYRVETYGRILAELERLTRVKKITELQAEQTLTGKLDHAEPGDLPLLLKGLRMIHPDRQTPLMKWLVNQYASF